MKSITVSIHRPSRAGLSLLELLVALTLGSVLLSAVWAMFSIFSRRLESDTFKAEETQLLRGVHQILSRDLGNVLPQSDVSIERGISIVPGTPQFSPQLSGLAIEMATRKGSGPRASFVGTPDRLVLQLFDDDPDLLALIEPISQLGESKKGEPIHHHSSKIVIYSWQGSQKGRIGLDGPNDPPIFFPRKTAEPLKPGLSRKEAYSQVEPGNDASEPGSFSRTMSPTPRLSKPYPGFYSNSAPVPARKDIVISDETIPEITRLDFAYYDGRLWRSNWNSRDGGNLPIAVRVRFDVEMKYVSDNPDVKGLDRDMQAFRETMEDSSQPPGDDESWNQEFILIVSQPSPAQLKESPALERTRERPQPKF